MRGLSAGGGILHVGGAGCESGGPFDEEKIEVGGELAVDVLSPFVCRGNGGGDFHVGLGNGLDDGGDGPRVFLRLVEFALKSALKSPVAVQSIRGRFAKERDGFVE